MKFARWAFLTLAVGSFAGVVCAQPGPGGGMGPGHGPRWNSDNTPGWSLMTPQEREEHQKRMSEMKSREECQAYVAKQHEQMMERAKEKGRKVPAKPRHDPCANLKP